MSTQTHRVVIERMTRVDIKWNESQRWEVSIWKSSDRKNGFVLRDFWYRKDAIKFAKEIAWHQSRYDDVEVRVFTKKDSLQYTKQLPRR